MPRATRAALRAQELLDDATTAANIALPATPKKDRQPLGEISNNANATIETSMPGATFELGEPAAKGKKGKCGRKAKKGTAAKVENKEMEILEDDNQSSQSDAVEEACSDLLNNAFVTEPATVAISDETVSLTSPAAESASKQLAPNDALQSDHISYKPMEEADLQLETADEDASQKSNLVDQKKEYISTPHTVSPDKSKDDPPSEQVKRQTPTRRISRIEDSVEALDALEEAIESIDQAMPAPKNDISSSVAVTKGTKNATKSEERKPTISRRPTKAAPNKSKDTPASTEIKSSNTLRSGGAKSATAHQIQMKASLLGGSPANGPRSTQPLAETQIKAKTQPSKRVSSLHKAPFLPAKSTKPLTTSNFELPGETVARKLKEQREERQKKEEEERTKAQPFKARPVPVHRTPEVKLTASAKARLSMAQNAPPNDTKPKAALLTGNISASPTNRRQSTLNVSKRTTASPMSRCSPPTANTSIKRQPSLSATMKSRKPSILNEPRPVPTAEDLAHQRMKGKEVFNRPKMMLCEKEKERKAKEEAAKKARVEAAERGRIASREWAEKQKARQMAVKKIKEGEDGATTA